MLKNSEIYIIPKNYMKN